MLRKSLGKITGGPSASKPRVNPGLWLLLVAVLTLNVVTVLRVPIIASVDSVVSAVNAKRNQAEVERRWLEQIGQMELSTETLDKTVQKVNAFQYWFGVGPYEQGTQEERKLSRPRVVNY